MCMQEYLYGYLYFGGCAYVPWCVSVGVEVPICVYVGVCICVCVHVWICV